MPIIIKGAKSLLVCVNHEHPTHLAANKDTTMSTDVGMWFAVQGIVPPTNGKVAQFMSTGPSLPVRVYSCNLCGYVELYAAGIVEPSVWVYPR